jgi:hypothetical protein
VSLDIPRRTLNIGSEHAVVLTTYDFEWNRLIEGGIIRHETA